MKKTNTNKETTNLTLNPELKQRALELVGKGKLSQLVDQLLRDYLQSPANLDQELMGE